MKHENDNITLSTTKKSLDILNFIKNNTIQGVTASDIIKKFNLAKSTAHTHLHTLEKEGYIVRDNSRYYIGMRVIELSEHARTRNPSYQDAENIVNELGEESKAEAEFLVEENGRLILLFHSARSVFDRQSEPYMYLHNTAAGKAIMAEMPNERINTIIDRWGLPSNTDNTITNKSELLEELNNIQDRGYSYNNEEWFEGYHGIGSAIEDIDGDIFGALTIGGPIYRLSEQTLKQNLSEILLEKVDELEEQIESRGIDHLQ